MEMVPGGFAFANDGDLIVGSLSDGSVDVYHDGTMSSQLIAPYTSVGNDNIETNGAFLMPASIVAENNGNLLIADLNFDHSNNHHQVVEYDAANQSLSQFINLTTPLGSNGTSYSQPESLLLDQDGNLLVGVSPDHDGNGAVQEYNINTGALITTLVSGIGTPAGLAYVPSEQSDLLVGDYDDNDVLRIADSSESGYPAEPGGVAAGSSPLGYTSGVAVAPDGTYYVSSLATDQVLHYSSVGAYLGYLGENDSIQSPLQAPGTLAFGPNGNLYVGDLYSGAIFQFNTNSPTQQYQPDGTTTLVDGDAPGGFTFAANGDLIVGSLSDGSVDVYHDGTMSSQLIAPYTSVGNDNIELNGDVSHASVHRGVEQRKPADRRLEFRPHEQSPPNSRVQRRQPIR